MGDFMDLCWVWVFFRICGDSGFFGLVCGFVVCFLVGFWIILVVYLMGGFSKGLL